MQVVAEGLRVPEGPVALDDGSVLVVEVMGQTLSRVRPDGSTHVVARLGGGPNGAAIGPDGAVYVCNNGGLEMEWADGRLVRYGRARDYAGGSIQRVELSTGKVETLFRDGDGRRLRGPNDIVFDAAGGFWFTDPDHGPPQAAPTGALYYATPDGAQIRRVRDGLLLPNGIGLAPDGARLYVADSRTASIWCGEIAEPGVLRDAGREVGRQTEAAGMDSLAVEASGRICVASAPERICVITPNGPTENVAVADVMPTNLCFGGADMRDVWITAGAGGRLIKTRWPRPGAKLAFGA